MLDHDRKIAYIATNSNKKGNEMATIYIHPALINPFALAKLERETGLKAVATGPETPARLIDPTNRPAPCPRAWAGPHTHTPDGAA